MDRKLDFARVLLRVPSAELKKVTVEVLIDARMKKSAVPMTEA
jgi:hypothetical protein